MANNGGSDNDDAVVPSEPIRWRIKEPARQIADLVSRDLGADVIFYNGPIGEPYDRHFIEACAYRNKLENVLLILVTAGGDPDSAFRMASWIQQAYENFTLYVTGRCKSAGTLIAMGAHELVMSLEHGELGPLDVQMPAPEEPDGRRSGLDFSNALLTLDNQAAQAYEKFLENIAGAEDDAVSSEYAMKIASEMSVGLYGRIYGQIDPMHIGQASRAMDIALEYGSRLLEEGNNSDAMRLRELISDYPSHEYVINPKEATRLFDNVYESGDLELALAVSLGEAAIEPHWPGEENWNRFIPFEFLSTEPDAEDDQREE